ncbi:hypothetical protein QEH52_01805 [Coraliomargarita sp. SDUM461003]|uniref:Uncharacterized protein n=1 Tax=Thalassobacterium maritimum TaxID=3041265 RepID=A0ABU1ATB5_9BACT|nr:hypothetical protein [Coraliomargarita sp. SDUM461003]MDQ8206227.1 hypothetical protein [Coraliomargarita sp. SDUM461003]
MKNQSLDFRFQPSGNISQELTVARMEAMRLAILRAQPPAKVKGARIGQTDKGWWLAVDPGTIAAAAAWPLKPVVYGATEVRFVYGLVHADPPKIDDEEILADIDDPDYPGLTCGSAGKIYVGVDLAADTYEPENPIIAFADTVPDDVDRSKAYVEIADVAFADGAITKVTPVHRGNIDMASCGGVLNYWDLGD